MTAPIANTPDQASINSPAAPSPLAPDVSSDTKRSRPIAPSCKNTMLQNPTPVMLCEVHSYKKGMHDNGLPEISETSKHCEACPWKIK